MADFDRELRLLLHERADDAPPGGNLLAATKVRSRRRTVRRRAAITGVAVLAVGAGALTVPALLSRSDGGPQPQVGAPWVAVTQSPSANALRFEPATTQPTVTFPYTPGFVPPGLPAASVFRTQTDLLMHMRQADNDHYLKVQVYTAAPDAASSGVTGTSQSITVRGHAGSYTESGADRVLIWPEKPGVWLSVRAAGVSRADLVQYAAALQDKPLSGTEAIRFTLVPAGMVIHETLHWNMTFARPGKGEPVVGVLVSLHGELPTSAGTHIVVGTRDAYLTTTPDGRAVVLDLGGGATLEVTVGLDCTAEDLLRFAGGITVDLSRI